MIFSYERKLKMFYNLESSQSDRINFDEATRRNAEGCLQSLTLAEALTVNPAEYAQDMWDMEEDRVSESVDDVEEAKARYLSVFKDTVLEWQVANG